MITWDYVVERLRALAPGQALTVECWKTRHPLDAGMTQTTGVPVGQRSDFRLVLSDQQLLHVRDFVDYYVVFLVNVAPRRPQAQPDLGPGGIVLGATALGALFGAALGGKNGALGGAIVGGMAGLAAVGVNSAASSPKTAAVAKDLFSALAQSVQVRADFSGAGSEPVALRKVVVKRVTQRRPKLS